MVSWFVSPLEATMLEGMIALVVIAALVMVGVGIDGEQQGWK